MTGGRAGLRLREQASLLGFWLAALPLHRPEKESGRRQGHQCQGSCRWNTNTQASFGWSRDNLQTPDRIFGSTTARCSREVSEVSDAPIRMFLDVALAILSVPWRAEAVL